MIKSGWFFCHMKGGGASLTIVKKNFYCFHKTQNLFFFRKIKAHFKNLEQNLNNTSRHNQSENIRLRKEVSKNLINLGFWV